MWEGGLSGTGDHSLLWIYEKNEGNYWTSALDETRKVVLKVGPVLPGGHMLRSVGRSVSEPGFW
jgi:hypothetical protein